MGILIRRISNNILLWIGYMGKMTGTHMYNSALVIGFMDFGRNWDLYAER